MFTLSHCLPLMIVVITLSGKSHFHKVTFFPSMSLFFNPSSSIFLLPLFLLCPSAPLLYSSSSHMHVSISLHSPALPLALTFHLSPVICSSLSPTPSFAPSIFSLLHGLASSLYLSPFIYINEQKSSFHLPPDEQTACGRGQERRGAEEQGFCYFIILTRSRGGNITLYKLSVVRGGHLTCFGWLLKGLV